MSEPDLHPSDLAQKESKVINLSSENLNSAKSQFSEHTEVNSVKGDHNTRNEVLIKTENVDIQSVTLEPVQHQEHVVQWENVNHKQSKINKQLESHQCDAAGISTAQISNYEVYQSQVGEQEVNEECTYVSTSSAPIIVIDQSDDESESLTDIKDEDKSMLKILTVESLAKSETTHPKTIENRMQKPTLRYVETLSEPDLHPLNVAQKELEVVNVASEIHNGAQPQFSEQISTAQTENGDIQSVKLELVQNQENDNSSIGSAQVHFVHSENVDLIQSEINKQMENHKCGTVGMSTAQISTISSDNVEVDQSQGDEQEENKECNDVRTSSNQSDDESITNIKVDDKFMPKTLTEESLVKSDATQSPETIQEQYRLQKIIKTTCKYLDLDWTCSIMHNKMVLSQRRSKQVKETFKNKSYKEKVCQVIHITGMPNFFTCVNVKILILLHSNFNVDSDFYMIDVFGKPVSCLIRFVNTNDCQQVYQDLQGITLKGAQMKVKLDLDHVVVKERYKTFPEIYERFRKMSERYYNEIKRKNKGNNTDNTNASAKTNVVNDNVVKMEDTVSIEESKTKFADQVAMVTERIVQLKKVKEVRPKEAIREPIREPKPDCICAGNCSGDKGNMVYVKNLSHGSAKVLDNLIKTRVSKNMKYFIYRRVGELNQEYYKSKTCDYMLVFSTPNDVELVCNNLNKVVVNSQILEARILKACSVGVVKLARQSGVFTLKRKLESHDYADNHGAKKGRFEESNAAVDLAVAYCPLETRSLDTYGLHPTFLKKLGIKLPLCNKVTVTNLHETVSEAKLLEVFSLAGVVKDIEMVSPFRADIEFDHPVEAVQAISLFDNQTLYEKVMSVSMSNSGPDKLLPLGLAAIGTGLGINGRPLRGIRTVVEELRVNEMFADIGKMKRIPVPNTYPFIYIYEKCHDLNTRSNKNNGVDDNTASSSVSSSTWHNNSPSENPRNTDTSSSVAIQTVGAATEPQSISSADTNSENSQGIRNNCEKDRASLKRDVHPDCNTTTDPAQTTWKRKRVRKRNDSFSTQPQTRSASNQPQTRSASNQPQTRSASNQPQTRSAPTWHQANTAPTQPQPWAPTQPQLNSPATATQPQSCMASNYANQSTNQFMLYMSSYAMAPNMPQSNIPNYGDGNQQNYSAWPYANQPAMYGNQPQSNWDFPPKIVPNLNIPPPLVQNVGQSVPIPPVPGRRPGVPPPALPAAPALTPQNTSQIPTQDQPCDPPPVAQKPAPAARPTVPLPITINIGKNKIPGRPKDPPSTARNSGQIPTSARANLSPPKTQNEPSQSSNKNMRRQTRFDEKSDEGASKSNGPAEMLMFKNLPPSVTSRALSSKMREVGELAVCELLSDGNALVRFTSSEDTRRCIRLFKDSKVDGQVIDVTIV